MAGDDEGLFDNVTDAAPIDGDGDGSGYGADAADGYSDVPTAGDDSNEKKPKQRKRQYTGPRASAANLLTMAWSGAGTWLVRSNADVPVGRVMQFQAPLAGNKIDELIQGTFVDALIQPFVRQADKMEGLGAIFAFPVLVGVYERNYETNPGVAQMLEPLLREVVMTSLVEMAPLIRKKKADAKRAAQAMPEIREMLDLDKGMDPVEAVFASIFAPIEGTVTEEATE